MTSVSSSVSIHFADQDSGLSNVDGRYKYKTGGNSTFVDIGKTPGKVFDFVGSLAPVLAEPKKHGPESIQNWLMMIGSAITMLRGETEMSVQEAGRAEREQQIARAEEARKTAETQAAEAKEKAKEERITGWITAVVGAVGAIAGVVAAVAATVASVGAATPLAIVAAAGAIMAVQELVNMGLKEEGVMAENALNESKQLDIGFGGIVDRIVDAQIADGSLTFSSDEEKNKYKADWAIGVSVAIAAAMIIGSLYGAYKVDLAMKAGKSVVDAATKGMQKIERWAEVVNISSELASAGTQAYQGQTDLLIAELDLGASRARAMKGFYETLIKEIGQRMNISHEAMKTILEKFNENFEQMVENVEGANRNGVMIANHMS
jgi:hypothetical protein